MKRTHIIALIIIAVGMGIVVSTLSTTSEYASFAEAKASNHSEFTVVGELDRSYPVNYNPKLDPGKTHFQMKDKQGTTMVVTLLKPKPTDFEKSEDIVVKGQVKDNVFLAHTILLKCPSKYNEQNAIATTQR